MKTVKSEWTSVWIGTEAGREAVRSWFHGMADGLMGPSKANILTRMDDDRILKLRALFTDEKGKPRELVRTNRRAFTITISAPKPQRWA